MPDKTYKIGPFVVLALVVMMAYLIIVFNQSLHKEALEEKSHVAATSNQAK